MSIVVIGGQTRNIGKTSVVVGLIAALPELHWTALKISLHRHNKNAANDEPGGCETSEFWAVTEELNRSGDSDTARFLAAGAVSAWWVHTDPGRLADAMPHVRSILAAAENAIIESNSILQFVKPDLYLTVLDPGISDFKLSAREVLDRADAILIHKSGATLANAVSDQMVPEALPKLPTFPIRAPDYVTPELMAFVRAHLTNR
ncbi:MAG: hypothetical protein WBS24_08050 [Terriglobales bacterium]